MSTSGIEEGLILISEIVAECRGTLAIVDGEFGEPGRTQAGASSQMGMIDVFPQPVGIVMPSGISPWQKPLKSLSCQVNG